MNENGRSLSLREQAYQRIKQKIVSLKLAPGSVIDETALRAELGLGRTPIREALQRLALEKLVVIIPRRGMFVADIGVMDLQRLFEVRVVLEGMAAKLAAQRGTKEHWQRMENILKDLPHESEDPNNEITIAIDQTCHEIIYEATDNVFLQDTLNMMYALNLRSWYFALSKVDKLHSAVLEHVDIMNALKAGDSDSAALLLEQHIKAFRDEIQAGLLGAAQPG
jgi:DNA-binding GntR family transcriptional regulator